MEEANRIIREGQLAQQLPMPRPIATAHATLNATASIGNHTTVLMGVNVNPQHITRTILNQQQQHTIINATGTTATLQQTLQTDTMLHHTKPDLSLPDAKKPRMLDPSASSQLQPVSTTYVDLSTPTTNLTGQDILSHTTTTILPPVLTTTLTAPPTVPAPTTQPPNDLPMDPNAPPPSPRPTSRAPSPRPPSRSPSKCRRPATPRPPCGTLRDRPCRSRWTS